MTTLPPFAVPTIHLNGTSGEELARQVKDAADAVYTAIGALRNAAPNARDYYPQGDNAFRDATAAHWAHVESLQATYTALADVYEALIDAGAV